MSGRLVVMGSGETAPTMVRTHRHAITAADADEVVLLDSPFGFQENAAQLTERLVDFFETSLNIGCRVASLPSRHADPLTVERFRTVVAGARAVFAGPGSPSYALDVWREHGVGKLLTEVILRGGSVTLASAAALTVGTHTIPVYEIYKVGAPPHWLTGLDLLAPIGILASAVVPHWNNAEGGNHDTSRCYIGERRLTALEAELDRGVIGVDEHTAVAFDVSRRRVEVTGKGVMTLRGRRTVTVPSGDDVSFDEVGSVLGAGPAEHRIPEAGPPPDSSDFDLALDRGDADALIAAMLDVEAEVADRPELHTQLRTMIVRLGDAARSGISQPRATVGGFVDLLLDLRREAREAGRYEDSDRIRDRLAVLGVEVRDTPDGQEWVFEAQKP